jgi:hypothetical protein
MATSVLRAPPALAQSAQPDWPGAAASLDVAQQAAAVERPLSRR